MGVQRETILGNKVGWVRKWWIITNAIPVLASNVRKTPSKATKAPADIPMQTTGKLLEIFG
jgi:hypothetical protein